MDIFRLDFNLYIVQKIQYASRILANTVIGAVYETDGGERCLGRWLREFKGFTEEKRVLFSMFASLCVSVPSAALLMLSVYTSAHCLLALLQRRR